MIIVLKPHTTKDDVSRVENMVKKRGLDTHIVQGKEMTVIGCIGDTAKVDGPCGSKAFRSRLFC